MVYNIHEWMVLWIDDGTLCGSAKMEGEEEMTEFSKLAKEKLKLIERDYPIIAALIDMANEGFKAGQKDGYQQCLLDNDLATTQEVFDNTEVVIPKDAKFKECKHPFAKVKHENDMGYCPTCERALTTQEVLDLRYSDGIKAGKAERFAITEQEARFDERQQARKETLEEIKKIIREHPNKHRPILTDETYRIAEFQVLLCIDEILKEIEEFLVNKNAT